MAGWPRVSRFCVFLITKNRIALFRFALTAGEFIELLSDSEAEEEMPGSPQFSCVFSCGGLLVFFWLGRRKNPFRRFAWLVWRVFLEVLVTRAVTTFFKWRSLGLEKKKRKELVSNTNNERQIYRFGGLEKKTL